MQPRLSTRKNLSAASPRDRQRYHFIRYLAELQGLKISDLHAQYTAGEARPCHFSVFYRVCQGNRTSARVQRWLSRKLRVPHLELWS